MSQFQLITSEQYEQLRASFAEAGEEWNRRFRALGESLSKVSEALEATRRAIVSEHERVDWTPLAAAMERVREAAGVTARGSNP